jgi:hypothetical protein
MQCSECPPPGIRDRDAANFDRLVARFNRLTLDFCEPTLEKVAQHVRRDPVCEQERLRNSALTAGKQLKRLAPLHVKTTPSRGHRHFLQCSSPQWVHKHHEWVIWHSLGRNVAPERICKSVAERTPVASWFERAERGPATS